MIVSAGKLGIRPWLSPLAGFASSALSIGAADCLWAPGNTADRRSCGPKTAEYRQWTRGSHLAPTGRSLRPRALKRSCPPHRGQRAQRSPSVPQTAAQHLWAASSSTSNFLGRGGATWLRQVSQRKLGLRPWLSPLAGFASATLSIGAAECRWAPGSASVHPGGGAGLGTLCGTQARQTCTPTGGA